MTTPHPQIEPFYNVLVTRFPVGTEFNAKDLKVYLDCTWNQLWLALRQAQRDGLVEFKGPALIWKRLK